jgi:isocitrate dehydrogenase kinase/phosphatase
MNSNTTLRPAAQAVAAIHSAYAEYERGFEEITGRARTRFEQRDWVGAQGDARARLELYRTHVNAAVDDVRDILETP